MTDSHTTPDAHPTLATLADLPIGQAGVVTELTLRGAERRRLMDLGLVPGTVVVAEMRSPLGDPVAYRVRGASVALRRAQAQQIHITAPDRNPSDPASDTTPDIEAR